MADAMAKENVSRLTRNQELTEATRMNAMAVVAMKMTS
jgi:hypothetical protein